MAHQRVTFVGRPPFGWDAVTVETEAGSETLAAPILGSGEAWHSPTGYAWGYGGSGPAELARAILVRVFRGTPAEALVRHPAAYMTFKWDVVAGLPSDGFRLEAEAVRRWFEAWRGHNSEPLPTAEEESRKATRP
jgi:hypothetical protein